MSKPSTPVRRAKAGPGRPSSAGGEIPLTASMEVLTPDPCMPQLIGVGRSQEFHGPAVGAKPRTPGSAPLTRTRSTDGRRSASGHHEVISLTSTSSKAAHPITLPLSLPHTASTTSSIIMASPVGLAVSQSAQLPSAASAASLTYSMAGGSAAQVPSRMDFTAVSQTSSRFNPVTEGDEDSLQPRAQSNTVPEASTTQSGDALRESCHVVVGGSAAAVAQRAAAAAGATGRRYDTPTSAVESVALSQEQLGRQGLVTADGEGGSGTEWQLRREESEQVPGTPASVVSGRVSGVFFTDLQRSFGGDEPPSLTASQDLTGALRYGPEDYDMYGSVGTPQGPRTASARREGAASVMSRLNPMQSPSASENGDEDDDDGAFAEYAGEELLTAAAGGGGAEGGPRPTSVPDTSLARSGASGLTDLVNPLQTPSESRATTPLLPSVATGTPTPAAPSTSASNSLLLVIHDLYVTDIPDPHPDGESSPHSPLTAATPPPVSPAPAAAAAGRRNSGGDGGGDAVGGGDVGPQQGAQEQPGADRVDDADAARLAASRAAVAELAARSDSQQALRVSELGEYMVALQERKDESGSRLVELPADWGIMLERLFRQRRNEFATLEGWLGPRRFEDLPISQLPSGHPDPRVEEGLARIRELDSVLNDKLIAALISHRETFPNQWVEQERRRLEKHTRAVEEALKRERQKRLRAARISRAVTSLDGPVSGSDSTVSLSYGAGSVQGMPRLASQASLYSRMFVLKPEEEELVERVLKRNDEEGVAINPFDLESSATYNTVEVTVTPASDKAAKTDGGWGPAAAPAGSVTDPEDINLDLLLPSAVVSACSTPTAPTPSAPSRPLSARLVDRDAGWPQSAASSYAGFRPGTAAGGGGGGGGGTLGMLSPLAGAALRGHPALLAAASPRGGAAAGNGFSAGGGGGGLGGGGLLPEHAYDDPRVAARALRAINARLAAFESEHLWDESGVLADFKSVTASCSVGQLGSPQPSVGEAGGATEGGAAPPVSPGARAGVKSVLGDPVGSVSGVSVTAGGQRDYLREERLAKELASRERNVDAALRSLKTSEVVRLGEATLKALVEQCRRLQELNDHRRQIEEAEAAARKAQQFKQQQLSRSSSARITESGKTPKGASAPAGGNPSTPGGAAGSSRTTSAGPAGRGAAEGTPAGGSGPPGVAQRQSGGAVPNSANGKAPASSAASGRRRSSTDAPPPPLAVPGSSSAAPTQPAPVRGSTSGSTTAANSGSSTKGGRVGSAGSAASPVASAAAKPKLPIPKAATAAPASPAVAPSLTPPLTASWEGGLPPPPPPPPP